MKKRFNHLSGKVLSFILSVTVASGTLAMAPVVSAGALETGNSVQTVTGISIDKF